MYLLKKIDRTKSDVRSVEKIKKQPLLFFFKASVSLTQEATLVQQQFLMQKVFNIHVGIIILRFIFQYFKKGKL